MLAWINVVYHLLGIIDEVIDFDTFAYSQIFVEISRYSEFQDIVNQDRNVIFWDSLNKIGKCK